MEMPWYEELWRVEPDDKRLIWDLEPHLRVGPLRFGMSLDETTDALDGATPTSSHYVRDELCCRTYPKPGLRLWYADHKLWGITVEALQRPQETFDGVALVGQVPSEIEYWLSQRAELRPKFTEIFYMPGAECGSFSLGMVACVQRAGDRLVTRPVFLPAEANDDMYHQLPTEAWSSY